ncbi:g6835 [Coccomyxa viridis]|uniref:G6835 protein n=1 Tax=Coccomyxa viridis TaxID=1274662 RepID=A0ABP1FWD5_9CHLO
MGRRVPAVRMASTSSSGNSFAKLTDVTTGGGGGGGGGFDILTAVAGLTLWAGSVGYAFFLSPNQTPYRDMYFLMKLTGLGENDGVQVNAVFTAICLMMGVWPCIYSALLIPSARSGNKVPAWPFVSLSFAFGVFALGPYFALWKPSKQAQSPPAQQELQGWRNLGLKATESKIAGFVLLAGNIILLGQAAFAGADSWTEYFQLFRESRFVHVTSLDFTALTLFSPFWMWNDADKRQWEGRQLLPILSCIPFLGPAIYLALRPKAQS